MAYADYRPCDVCGCKAFYDANLSYTETTDPNEMIRGWDGTKLHWLGDWAVICRDCAKTHRCEVVKIEAPGSAPGSDGDRRSTDAPQSGSGDASIEASLRDEKTRLRAVLKFARTKAIVAGAALARRAPDWEWYITEVLDVIDGALEPR
jgi:hypothetical protein